MLSSSCQNFTTIAKRNESYSGIEGAGIPSKLRVEIPMDFGSLKYNFVSDTIGGSGDRCPFLFPNSHCLQHQTITFHSFFENGDGLLLFPRLNMAVRMLLTDSGHYMLPIVSDERTDYCFKISADNQGRVQALVSALAAALTGGAPNGIAQPRAAVGSESKQASQSNTSQSNKSHQSQSQFKIQSTCCRK